MTDDMDIDTNSTPEKSNGVAVIQIILVKLFLNISKIEINYYKLLDIKVKYIIITK